MIEVPTLNWIGKDKVVNHANDVPFHVLERKYSFDAQGKHEEDNGSQNKIIHGDNLLVLKSLLPEYEGKIKCIYIDPPYNTGNEGWIYNDNVNSPQIKKWIGEVVGKEGEDLSRHDKWLCMMYPRLKLLRRLLADDGAIFISIDSNELANLTFLCNEIFGITCFVDYISWFKKASPSNDAKYFSNDIEYILVYVKNKSIWKPNRLPLTDKQLKNYQNPDNDPRGKWNSATYTCNKTKIQRPNLYYPIMNPNTGEEILPKDTAVWAYSKEQYIEHAKNDLIYWGVDGKSKIPRFKKFLSGHQGVVNRTLWHYDDVNHTQGASIELKKINIYGFDTPKPTKLISRIIQIAMNKDSIILDSFAGSGTTAHAVLKLNKEDGGNRKFILVEMEDYAERITAERVKRVIQGYGDIEGTGGDFNFYEIGEPLLVDDDLNESVPLERIRAYVWYTETKTPYIEPSGASTAFLGAYKDTAYYFHYEKDNRTSLDFAFLQTISEKATNYVIYADECALDDDFLASHSITFKKIPRDISKL